MLTVLDKENMVQVLENERSGVLVYIKKVELPVETEASEQKEKELKKWMEGRSGQYVSSLIASFYRDAKIEINESILGNLPEESL